MTLVEEVSDLHTKIVECVDAGLKEIGQSVMEVLYFHLEKNFGIKKNEIPVQPEAFSQALHSIFGQGANVIEKLIVREIQKKFKLRVKSETSLVEVIQIAKNAT